MSPSANLPGALCSLNINYDQRRIINCLTQVLLYFGCTKLHWGTRYFLSSALGKNLGVLHSRLLICGTVWALSSDWLLLTTGSRSCFLISNLDCSEEAAVLHAAQDMRVTISGNIIYGDQNILLLRGGNWCFLLDQEPSYKWKRWKIKFSGFVRIAAGSELVKLTVFLFGQD